MIDPIFDILYREETVSIKKTSNATQQEVQRVAKTAIDLNASLRSMRLGIPNSFIGNH